MSRYAERDRLTLRGWEYDLEDIATGRPLLRHVRATTYRDTDPRSDLAELIAGHFARLIGSGDFDLDQAALDCATVSAVADAVAKGWAKSFAKEEADECAAQLAAEWLEVNLAYVAEAL